MRAAIFRFLIGLFFFFSLGKCLVVSVWQSSGTWTGFIVKVLRESVLFYPWCLRTGFHFEMTQAEKRQPRFCFFLDFCRVFRCLCNGWIWRSSSAAHFPFLSVL